jgi:putative toxin-antitoxin system antitoxin component (TIGR02293 family)
MLAQAIKTFGSKDNAEAWLNSPVISLGMKRPIDLLVTTEGAQQVETILGRIESGTYT